MDNQDDKQQEVMTMALAFGEDVNPKQKPLVLLAMMQVYQKIKGDDKMKQELLAATNSFLISRSVPVSASAYDAILSQRGQVRQCYEDVRSCYSVSGCYYAMSQILGDDPENSYYLMQLAALEHNAHASLLCGEEELRRMGTPAFRYERVSRYANEAIEGGEYDGYYLLACLEKRGDSNFKDSGIAYLLKGIEKQSGICADTLGRYYEGGTEENDERAMDYFQKAMEWHHPLGTYDFGRTFLGPAFHRVDLKQAEKYMRLAADLGCTDADYALGRHYEDGDFGTVDYPSAERYFVKGMECHSENCFYALAYLQVFYDVKQPRYEWARHAFLHLSHKGWRYASFNLGSMAYYGYGQKINYLEALEYYCLAADQGDGRGAYLAGEMLHSGKLVTPDPKRALHFLSLAAQKGEVDAAMLLAKMYETGDGVTKDLNLAATYRAQAKSAKA